MINRTNCLFFKAVASFVLTTALISCSEPGGATGAKPGALEVNVSSLPAFPSEGGNAELKLTSGAEWMATAPQWVRLAPASASACENLPIAVKVLQNDEFEPRKAVIEFSSKGKSVGVEISQDGSSSAEDPSLPESILSVDFTKNDGGFTIENKGIGSLDYVWQRTSDYGMKGSAFVNSATAAQSWLVSPEIDLSGRNHAYMNFSHAAKFFSDAEEQMTLKVTTDGGQSWKDVAIPNYPDGKSWSFVNSGDIDLSEFCRSRIKVAFAYKSSASAAPTWEIKNVNVFRNPVDMGAFIKEAPSWLELPKIDGDGRVVYHIIRAGGEYVRNYTYNYDEGARLALWVAYPQCDFYMKNDNKRSDAWGYDPLLPASVQPNLAKSGDFYANGYDRGHQIASADRYVSAEMNAQTFYYTNMAPMLTGNKFNSGRWNDVEDKVRDWSRSSKGTDTLYVVTGCVLDRSGQGKTVKDNDGKTVQVPSAFYKALLRYSKSEGSYKGFAVYMDHRDLSAVNGFKQFVMSIDELESMLGMDFFPNLEAIVGKEQYQKIESANPLDEKFWWNN